VVVRASAQRPLVLSLYFLDRKVVDARDAAAHEPPFIKFPVLIAVGAKPISRIIAPFVGETYSNPIGIVDPEFLDKTIVEFFGPFPGQELNDGRSTCRNSTRFRQTLSAE
jgi:hypothetical protein